MSGKSGRRRTRSPGGNLDKELGVGTPKSKTPNRGRRGTPSGGKRNDLEKVKEEKKDTTPQYTSLIATFPESHVGQALCHSDKVNVIESIEKEGQEGGKRLLVFLGPPANACWLKPDGPTTNMAMRAKKDETILLEVKGHKMGINKELQFWCGEEETSVVFKWCLNKNGTLSPLDPAFPLKTTPVDLCVGLRKNLGQAGEHDRAGLVLVKKDDAERCLKFRLGTTNDDLGEDKGELANLFDDKMLAEEDAQEAAREELAKAQEDAMNAMLARQRKQREESQALKTKVYGAVQRTELAASGKTSKAERERDEALQRAEYAEKDLRETKEAMAKLTENLRITTEIKDRAEKAEAELTQQLDSTTKKLKKTADSLAKESERAKNLDDKLDDTKEKLDQMTGKYDATLQRAERAEDKLGRITLEGKRMRQHMRSLKENLSEWAESAPSTPWINQGQTSGGDVI